MGDGLSQRARGRHGAGATRAPLIVALAACHAAPVEPIEHHTGPSACIRGDRGYLLARVRGDVVLCSTVDCFTLLDGGRITARSPEPVPAVSDAYEGTCARGLCWSATPAKVRIAFNPDGKRAALIDQNWDVTIYDVATSRPVAKFHADIPGEFWFIGDTVYIASAPAGPGSELYAFSFDGKFELVPGGMFHGNVALSDPQHLVFEDNGLRSVELLDGLHAPARSVKRRVPAGPCEAPEDGDEWKDLTGACGDYVRQQFARYDRSYVIADGDRDVGFTPETHELFWVDATTLAERERVRLVICPGTDPDPHSP